MIFAWFLGFQLGMWFIAETHENLQPGYAHEVTVKSSDAVTINIKVIGE